MDPIFWISVMLVLGIVLLVAELLLPTHGLLGIIAIGCFGVAIIYCFMLNRWLGIGVFAGAILASPVIGALMLRAWQNSPIGRRLTLTTTAGEADHSAVMIGQIGTAVSELRPTGEVEFDDHRFQGKSDAGWISAGTRVRVIAFANGVATVRPVPASTPPVQPTTTV